MKSSRALRPDWLKLAKPNRAERAGRVVTSLVGRTALVSTVVAVSLKAMEIAETASAAATGAAIALGGVYLAARVRRRMRANRVINNMRGESKKNEYIPDDTTGHEEAARSWNDWAKWTKSRTLKNRNELRKGIPKILYDQAPVDKLPPRPATRAWEPPETWESPFYPEDEPPEPSAPPEPFRPSYPNFPNLDPPEPPAPMPPRIDPK